MNQNDHSFNFVTIDAAELRLNETGDTQLQTINADSFELVTTGDILGTDANNSIDMRGATVTNVGEVNVGDGNDSVYDSDGDTTIRGGDGNDRLYGYGGDDTLVGGSGTNDLRGGAGDDSIIVSDGVGDYVDGGAGTDSLTNEEGDLSLRGLRGVENIDGGGGDILGTDANNSIDMRGATVTNVEIGVCAACGADHLDGLLGLNFAADFVVTLDAETRTLLLDPRRDGIEPSRRSIGGPSELLGTVRD